MWKTQEASVCEYIAMSQNEGTVFSTGQFVLKRVEHISGNWLYPFWFKQMFQIV